MPEEMLVPAIAALLFALGVYVLARSSVRGRECPLRERPISRGFLSWVL
jgi:hypothetical protein